MLRCNIMPHVLIIVQGTENLLLGRIRSSLVVNQGPRMRRTCLLLTLLLTLCGYVTARRVHGIREVDFKNQTFPFTTHIFGDLPRRIRVRNGLYHSPHQEPSLNYTYFKVAEIVVGNLTGSGRDE